ncbi:amidohydrolase family protein [Streptomyces sp. NPDC088354]|uniref:amidohydrolase family protein n=1 Tax=Streptomyces sp. NPDC088354 TaxID=3365856 RepID=UPI003830B2E5
MDMHNRNIAARPTPRLGQPVLFRRATVVTMKPHDGVLRDTDVLVRNSRIEAVGRHLEVPADAAVIEAYGALLLPGFVDTHRHMWQSALRGVGADWTLGNYVQWIMIKWGHLFRPEDIYAANYMSMVEAVYDGVTTVLDYSHGLRTPGHAEAAVDALFDVPARARFAYGNALASDLGWVVDGRVDDMLDSRFSSTDQLVTMQLALDRISPTDEAKAALDFARARELPIISHAGVFKAYEDDQIGFLHAYGALSPSYTLVHGGALSDDAFRLIADSGAHLSISAESEDSAGQGYPPVSQARRFGVPISLSMDSVAWWSGDMFSAMRATLNAERAMVHHIAHQQGNVVVNNDTRAMDVLEYATLGGARALGLDDEIGSITPGKRADLVLLRNDTPVMTTVHNPAGHLVFQAGRGDVDTVMVNGRVLKYQGRLVGVDLDRARSLVAQSVEYLRSRISDAEWEEAMIPPPYVTRQAW